MVRLYSTEVLQIGRFAMSTFTQKDREIHDLQRQMADLYGKDDARVADLALRALSLALEQVRELRSNPVAGRCMPASRLAA